MAWITSKTGRVYLAVCAGVTALLLARDLPRLFGWRQLAKPQEATVARFPIQPPRSATRQGAEVLPPAARAEDMTILPPITIKATDTVTLPSDAKFGISRLVKAVKDKKSVAFTPDGSPVMVGSFLPPVQESPQCYLLLRQEQSVPRPDQQLTAIGRWGGFSAANHRLIHAYTRTVYIALTEQEQKTGKVECVVPQMPLARTVAQLPLTNNSKETFTVDDCVIRYSDDLMEYTVTLPVKIKDTVDKDGFRVVLVGKGRDSRWYPIRLLETPTSSAFSQGRNTPEELRKDYRFRAVSQPSAPAEFDKVAVVLVPYQKVTITGIVTKSKLDAKP